MNALNWQFVAPADPSNLRHYACCDSSSNKHATKHFKASGHLKVVISGSTGRRVAVCCRDEQMANHQTALNSQLLRVDLSINCSILEVSYETTHESTSVNDRRANASSTIPSGNTLEAICRGLETEDVVQPVVGCQPTQMASGAYNLVLKRLS